MQDVPGLVDGEERMLGYYDEAIEHSPPGSAIHNSLVEMRQALIGKISYFKTLKVSVDAAPR